MTSYRLEVVSEADTRVGTCWPIAADLLVTAFHLVADSDPDPERRQWLADLPGRSITYRIRLDAHTTVELDPVTCDQHADVALLRLSSNAQPRLTLEPLPVTEWGAQRNASWSADGYAVVAGGALQPLTGRITHHNPNGGRNALMLLVDQGGGASWKGASGSPVKVAGCIVGVLTSEVLDAATIWAATVDVASMLCRLQQAVTFRERCIASLQAQLSPGDAGRQQLQEFALRLRLPATGCDACSIFERALRSGLDGIGQLLGQLTDQAQLATLREQLEVAVMHSPRWAWRESLADQSHVVPRCDEWFIPPLLESVWTQLLDEPRWPEKLRIAMERLTNAGVSPEIVQDFERLLLENRPYPALHNRLNEWLGRAWRSTRATGLHADAVRAFDHLEQLLHPHTARGCGLFLMGSSGSGKSYFAEAKLWQVEHTQATIALLLPVNLADLNAPTAQKVTAAILGALPAATGRHFDDFADLHQALALIAHRRDMQRRRIHAGAVSSPSRIALVFVIDDLHRLLTHGHAAEMVEILQHLIKECSRFSTLYWLIPLQDTLWDHVCRSSDAPDFWEEYGCVSRQAALSAYSKGGWIDLDRINESNQSGTNILRRRLGTLEVDAALQEAHAQGRHPDVLRHLQVPWFSEALLAHRPQECLQLIRTADLHYVDLVESLIAARLGLRAVGQSEYNATRRYFRCLAHVLVHNSGRHIRSAQLDREVENAAERAKYTFGPEELNQQIGRIASLGLLRTTEPHGNSLQQNLEIRVELLWSYKAACYLHEVLDGAYTPQHVLKDDRAQATPLQEGLLEFLLMLADRNFADDASQLELCIAFVTNVDAPAAWFAAPKGSERLQRFIFKSRVGAPVLSTGSNVPLNRRLLFAHLWFVDRVSRRIFGPGERLALLQANYRQIGSEGFASYLYAVASVAIGETADLEQLRECLLGLEGCEEALAEGALRQLAELSVQRLFELAGEAAGDQQEQTVERASQEALIYSDAAVETALRDQVRDANHDERWRRELFREWVLCDFCHRLAEQSGPVTAFDRLKALGWFGRSQHAGDQQQHRTLRRRAARERSREAIMAIGRYFHGRSALLEQSSGEGQQFYRLVSRLAAGTSTEREQAFHLIRHTVPTRGQSKVRINDRLAELLLKLANDEQLTRMKAFMDLFETNHGRPLNQRAPGKQPQARPRGRRPRK